MLGSDQIRLIAGALLQWADAAVRPRLPPRLSRVLGAKESMPLPIPGLLETDAADLAAFRKLHRSCEEFGRERFTLLERDVRAGPPLEHGVLYHWSVPLRQVALSGDLTAHLADEWAFIRALWSSDRWTINLPTHLLALYVAPKAEVLPLFRYGIRPTVTGEGDLPPPPAGASPDEWTDEEKAGYLFRILYLLTYSLWYFRPPIPDVALSFVVWHPDQQGRFRPPELRGLGGGRRREEALEWRTRSVVFVDRGAKLDHVAAQVALSAIRQGAGAETGEAYEFLVRYAKEAIGYKVAGPELDVVAREAVSQAVTHWIYPFNVAGLSAYLRRVGRGMCAERRSHPRPMGDTSTARASKSDLVTPREAAVIVGVSYKTIYNMAKAGKVAPASQKPVLFDDKGLDKLRSILAGGRDEAHRREVTRQLAEVLGTSYDIAYKRLRRAVQRSMTFEQAVTRVLSRHRQQLSE